MKSCTIIIAVGCIVLLVPLAATAQSICTNCHFSVSNGMHAAGVGACNMCHTMHNSQDGMLVDPDSPGGNQFLLNDSTPSDVCLNCHAGFVSETLGLDPLNPPNEIGAGNYVFLMEDNLNDAFGGATNPIPGDAAGHNINAPSEGLSSDGTLVTSPGGNFPSSALGCTSCHDPHGNDGFRMLNGVGPVQNGIFSFSAPRPDGFGLSIYHGNERANSHTAYNSGFSEWCGNCHGGFHNNTTAFVHPSGMDMGAPISAAYNIYNGSEDPLGGATGTAYLAQVPFEDSAVSYTSTEGPSAGSRIMCLTCHRAHASSAPDAGRWDFSVTLLSDDGVESGSYPLPDPYGSTAQRSLCNKCHAKDMFDQAP